METRNPTQTEYESNEEKRDRREQVMIFLTVVSVAVAVVSAVESCGSRKISERALTVAIDTLHMQRPYMSLGKEDGVVAEYVAPPAGKEKGIISLYFRNTGPVAATKFIVNAFRYESGNPFPPAPQQWHVERWQWLEPNGQWSAIHSTQGFTVGASSTYVFSLPQKSVPIPQEWDRIETGQPYGFLRIGGSLEYCDLWGKYTIECFSMTYAKGTNYQFVATPMECPADYPPPPVSLEKKRYIALQCEQPLENNTR